MDLPDSDDPDAEEITGRRDRADESLHEALHAVKVAFFPREEQEDECCVYFEIAGCTHGRPCTSGKMRAPWPWIVHDPRGPFCVCWRAAERRAWESRYAWTESKWGLSALQRLRGPVRVLAVSADHNSG